LADPVAGGEAGRTQWQAEEEVWRRQAGRCGRRRQKCAQQACGRQCRWWQQNPGAGRQNANGRQAETSRTRGIQVVRCRQEPIQTIHGKMRRRRQAQGALAGRYKALKARRGMAAGKRGQAREAQGGRRQSARIQLSAGGKRQAAEVWRQVRRQV